MLTSGFRTPVAITAQIEPHAVCARVEAVAASAQPRSPMQPGTRTATLATLLKPMGHATGQFGKHHLSDRDACLPTNHGFDEFSGNLYHLNAKEAPEHPIYPASPADTGSDPF